MTNVVNFPEQSRINEEASQWLIRLDSSSLSAEETKALSLWLGTSQYHRDTIIELCKLWDNMDILSELSELFPYDHKVVTKPGGFIGKLKISFAYASAAALVFLVIMLSLQQQFQPTGIAGKPSQREITYQTEIGEQKTVSLDDGSIVNLNTDSLVVVNFSDKQRDIRLISGEVYFKVAHDPNRPFLVHAGTGVVRAVGTAFSVRLKEQSMEIIVTEGKVEVAPTDQMKMNKIDNLAEIISDEYLATLEVGQTAEFSENKINLVKTIEPEDVSRKLSWQHGMLEFKGETLEEVVREISRYTDKKIIITDASIRDIRIGGYFKTGEVEALLAVLKDSFPIMINQINDDLIYLSDGNAVQATISN